MPGSAGIEGQEALGITLVMPPMQDIYSSLAEPYPGPIMDFVYKKPEVYKSANICVFGIQCSHSMPATNQLISWFQTFSKMFSFRFCDLQY